MFFDPFERIEKLRKHLKKLFRDTEVGIFTFAPMSGYKDGNNIVYEFELPGFSKQDIKLKVDNGFIDLKAEKKIDKKKEKKEKGKLYFYEEAKNKYIERKIPLPEGALIDKISAEYKNGILKVIIPVKPQNQGRDINIK